MAFVPSLGITLFDAHLFVGRVAWHGRMAYPGSENEFRKYDVFGLCYVFVRIIFFGLWHVVGEIVYFGSGFLASVVMVCE